MGARGRFLKSCTRGTRRIAGVSSLDDAWLNEFWLELANKMGIRIQVHTHPEEAFHSPTDDEFPIIHKPGFLSLVIPDFGLVPVGFERACVAEIQRPLAARGNSLAAGAHMNLRKALNRTLLLMRDEFPASVSLKCSSARSSALAQR
jgi:hypothetical protein